MRFKLQIKNLMTVMNGVGADLVKYIKLFPANADFTAKDVSENQKKKKSH